jgi:hypothetical protein
MSEPDSDKSLTSASNANGASRSRSRLISAIVVGAIRPPSWIGCSGCSLIQFDRRNPSSDAVIAGKTGVHIAKVRRRQQPRALQSMLCGALDLARLVCGGQLA